MTMTTTWDESYPPSVLHPLPPLPNVTGATPGTPGSWQPEGATVPSSLVGANALGLDLGVPWSGGAYVELNNAQHTHAYWDGTRFVSGEAPSDLSSPLITEPADGSNVAPMHAIRGLAEPDAVVELWVWDLDVGSEFRDVGTSATANGDGEWAFDGTEPMEPGDVSWKVIDGDGDESNVVTVHVIDTGA